MALIAIYFPKYSYTYFNFCSLCQTYVSVDLVLIAAKGLLSKVVFLP